MIHRCCGFKHNGEPCSRIVGGAFTYCYSHDPTRSEERKRNASKAGRGNSQRELRQLKEKLHNLLDDVLSSVVDTGRAAVAANVANALSKVYATSLKVKEAEELEGRIRQLEEQVDIEEAGTY